MFTIFKKQNKDLGLPLNLSHISSDIPTNKSKDKHSRSKKRSSSFANQKFNKNIINNTNQQQPKKSNSQSRYFNLKIQSQLDQIQCEQKIPETILKLQQKFKKLLKEIKENQSERIKINHFFQIFYRMKRHLHNQQRILTEQILLSIWKAIGGIQENSVDESVVFLTILYTENLLQYYKDISQTEKQKLIESIQMVQQKFKKYHKPKVLTTNKNKVNSDKQKIQDLTKKKNHKQFSKRNQNKTIQLKNKEKLHSSTLIQQTKPNKQKVKPAIKSFSQQNPCLQVTIKLRQGVFQKLTIYPNTSIDSLSHTFGNKHKLSAEKIKMIKAMIKSQLKKQLTQITEESVDNMSQISDLFNQLD